MDGGGYTDGLVGEEILLGARVLAVCDSYAAMTSERPYRRTMQQTAAVDEIRRCAGSQFDPEVVQAFCEVLDDEARGRVRHERDLQVSSAAFVEAAPE